MLQPTNRLTLIDATRPPAGFRFESAMAVTFTLNLRALLAAPAALALEATTAHASDDGAHEPIELLHALRSHANKLTVFTQAGEIALPPPGRVFAFLERAVVPVTAPRGGIVHPKVWVLRYEAVGAPPDSQSPERRLRVLIASRNLTFDASWDTVVRLDEASEATGASLAPIGDMFEGLRASSVGMVSTDHTDRVRSLSAALQTARFKLPDGVDDLHIHVLGLNDTPSPLPDAAQRSMIISPFVSDNFFTSVDASGASRRTSKQTGVVDGTKIHCWPLASAGNRRRVAVGEPLEIRFETSLEAISGFLAFELAHQQGTLTGFVVPVALTGVPEHRERALLRALVGNEQRFFRYLMALLDEESGQTNLLDAVEHVSRDAATDGHGPASLPVLEKLLRTMRRDPAKLAGLHPLVSDLDADGALPEGFAELWAMIYDVADAGAVSR